MARFVKLLRNKNDHPKRFPGWRPLLFWGFVALTAACLPVAADTPSVSSHPYTFYLNAWTMDNPENRLIPLDPQTLDAQPKGRSLELGQTWRLSSDGSTLVNVEYLDGRANQNPESIWIIVRDYPSGAERTRFHPPAGGHVSALSDDGMRLLLQEDANPYNQSSYPPTVDWYVVDTTNGELLAHIEDADNACFRQSAFLDPSGERIYCVVDPALTKIDRPGPMRIAAYDVESGNKAGVIELPEVPIGGTGIVLNNQSAEDFFEPAMVISPDGQRLAVVRADADEIILIDADSLVVEKTVSLNASTSLWELFGFAPTTAHAKGQMQGTIRQAAFSDDGQFLYFFSQEIWVNEDDAPEERGLWLVDLERGTLVAKALPDYQIQWVQPAPDGSVYAFGTTDERLFPYEIRQTSPSMLWRLDGRKLEVLAERPFTGYRSGRLVLGDKMDDVSETASQSVACPVTLPPETAFVPPEPWPAQPPGEDQFWFGESGLWTALPSSGSWRQLALGEKFWWWSEEFDVSEDSTPDLTVIARRLDGEAPVFQTTEATNGYHESFHWAMLAGVELASPGCWEFTGQYNGRQLSFVLWVPPE